MMGKSVRREMPDMEVPVQIVFHNLPHSEAIETKIRNRVDKLGRYCDAIIGCRVTVEAPHHHHRTGNGYVVRVQVSVPGQTLVAGREPDAHPAYTDVYVAIRDAFDTIRRHLEDYSRRLRRQVKAHETPLHGRVAELQRDQDFGRIETPDGRLVYFHRHSIVGADFDALAVGTEVRFDEEMGELGPQASTLHVIGKHHIAG
jgi:ribosome-associated translation inhibitor RaiA/cold shock CspA family protein